MRLFLKEQLKMEESFATSVLLQAIHRLPGGDDSKCKVIVRFLNILDRDAVMQAARNLKKGSGFSVIPDLNPESNKLRYELFNELYAMPVEEKKHYQIRYTKAYPFVVMKRVEHKVHKVQKWGVYTSVYDQHDWRHALMNTM